MKTFASSMLALVILLASCDKDNHANPTPPMQENVFQATINGQAYNFEIISSTISVNVGAKVKMLTIVAVSDEKSKRLILTASEQTDRGTGIALKPYALNAFPEDYPNTPNIDESLIRQGSSLYSTMQVDSTWLTNGYKENGSFTISACDSIKGLVSGSFETTLVNLDDQSNVVRITRGKLENVKYDISD